jgi:hypothetical protein
VDAQSLADAVAAELRRLPAMKRNRSCAPLLIVLLGKGQAPETAVVPGREGDSDAGSQNRLEHTDYSQMSRHRGLYHMMPLTLLVTAGMLRRFKD